MIVAEGDLRSYLGLSGTITADERTQMMMAHRRAEGLVKRELGYNPQQGTHTEFYPRADAVGGMGRREPDLIGGETGLYGGYSNRYSSAATLQLQHVPLRQVVNLYIDHGAYFGQANRTVFDGALELIIDEDDVTTDTVQTLGVDFYADLERPSFGESGCLYHTSVWPSEPGSVMVTYVAGYSPSELLGDVDADAVEADLSLGHISSVGVDASPISHAVVLTVAKILHTQQSLKKVANGFNSGFAGGSTYQSEKLQDYAYSRPSDSSGAGTAQLVGVGVSLPTEAVEALESFRHFGLLRL